MDYLHVSSDSVFDSENDLSTMDPKSGVKMLIDNIDKLDDSLDRALIAADEASNLISMTDSDIPQYKNNDWCVLSNIEKHKIPKYYKLNDDNYKEFVVVDIRKAPTKCCQGCGVSGYAVPERPSIPHEIVLKEHLSSTVYLMDTVSVCVDCLPDMSDVTVISHSWEPKRDLLPIRSIGTGSNIIHVSRKVVASLTQISGWIWVDALCNQSSADSNMRTRMYATCKLGVFTEQINSLLGKTKGWHQRLWCLIEAMYCRKISLLVIGQIDDRDMEMQLNEIKNMYGWFYATCRLFRISLNDRNTRQKIVHWGDTNWHSGREKAAMQLRVSISTAAIGWIAGVPSTLPGRCSCPKNACITEALLNYAYRNSHYGCETTLHGINIGLSPRALPEYPCKEEGDKKYIRWCTGKYRTLLIQHKCQHMTIIDSGSISTPSGDWYVFDSSLHLHCIETLPGELHMEKIRTILDIQDSSRKMKNGSHTDYCIG